MEERKHGRIEAVLQPVQLDDQYRWQINKAIRKAINLKPKQQLYAKVMINHDDPDNFFIILQPNRSKRNNEQL